MTKDEMVIQIAEKTGCTKLVANEVIDALVHGLTESIKRDGYAKIHRLCSFSLVERAPRTARNPRTGEEVRIEARTVVRIKPLQALRDAVEGRATRAEIETGKKEAYGKHD
jgi:DNA-binding protein HU-beta